MDLVSLFSGIAGLELGLQKSGFHPVVFCENDPYAQAVLKAHFPEVPIQDDITTMESIPKAMILTAGFPCQDLSIAGKQAGITGQKSGLIDHVFRLVKSNPPDYILLENVPGLRTLKKGANLKSVLSRITSHGYDWASRILDARSFGIPQRRKRLFILAKRRDSDGPNPWNILLRGGSENWTENRIWNRKLACGFNWTEGKRGWGWCVDAIPPLRVGSGIGIPSPPAIIHPSGIVGIPTIGDAERLMGLPADPTGWTGWTLPAENLDRGDRARWRLVGNAVIPDMVAWIGAGFKKPAKDVGSCRWMPTHKGWPRAGFGPGPSDGVLTIDAGDDPLRRSRQLDGLNLMGFLVDPLVPLSKRALSGFLSRARAGTLNFPDGLLEHLEGVLAGLT